MKKLINLRIILSALFLIGSIFCFLDAVSGSEKLSQAGIFISTIILCILIIVWAMELYGTLPLLNHLQNIAGSELDQKKSNSSMIGSITIYKNSMFGPAILVPLEKLNEQGNSLDYKNLIGLSYNAYTDKKSFARYMISALIILGLLGTFLGVKETVGPLRGFSTENGEILNILKASFSGLGTMFITSILGILASISIGLMNSWSNGVINQAFIDLEWFIQVHYIPYLHQRYKPQEKLVYEEVSRLNEKIDRLFERNIQELVTTVKENTTETAGHLRLLQASYMEKLEETNKNFLVQTQQNHKLYIGELLDNQNKFTDYMARYFGDLKISFETYFSEFLQRVQEENQKSVEQNRKEGLKFFQVLSDTSKELMDRLNVIIETITSQLEQNLVEIHGRYKQTTDQHLEALHQQFAEGAETVINSIVHSLEPFVSRQEELLASQEANFQSIQEKSSQILEQFSKKIHETQEEIKSSNQQQQKMLSSLLREQQLQFDQWKNFFESAEGVISQMLTDFQQFRDAHVAILHKEGEVLTSLTDFSKNQLAAANATLASVHTNQKEFSVRQVADLELLKDALSSSSKAFEGFLEIIKDRLPVIANEKFGEVDNHLEKIQTEFSAYFKEFHSFLEASTNQVRLVFESLTNQLETQEKVFNFLDKKQKAQLLRGKNNYSGNIVKNGKRSSPKKG